MHAMPHWKTLLCLSTCLILASCSGQSNSVTNNPSPATPDAPVTSTSQNQPTPTDPVAQSPIPNPVFEPILSRLKQDTKIPILLPDYIFGVDGATPVYAIVETANPSQYEIMLAFTEDCTGGTACRIGSVSGQAIAPENPPIAGETVDLDGGIQGYFVDAVCGANCSDSTVTWEQNGTRYAIGIKAGKPEELVKMANSAIASGYF